MQEPTIQQEMQFQREMQERQQSGDPNSVYADSMRDEKVRNVIAQLNPELLLSEIEHRIRGEKKIYAGGQEIGWELIDSKAPPISELLVQNYISFLNVYLTQNNSLSNFSPQEINNIMGVVIDYVRDDLTDNSQIYGLTTKIIINKKIIVKVMQEYTDSQGITYMKEHPVEVEQEVQLGEEKTDYNKLNRIGHIVCQSTFSVLKQAQNGMLASRIFKALRVTENLGETNKKDKLSFLKFW
jgi:ribonuclease BN (tRNA processing enzyme)